MEGNKGRFANITSFFVKHSSMAEGVDITKTGRHPNQRNNTEPYLSERLCRAWWKGFFKRCKWPKMGPVGGLGGRFLCWTLLPGKMRLWKIREKENRKPM